MTSDYTWREVRQDRLARAVRVVADRDSHQRGLAYTDGAGQPACLIGRVVAFLREVDELTWPAELELATFASEAVQDFLIVEYDLQFTAGAQELGTAVQNDADDGMPWVEIAEKLSLA